MFNNRHLMRQLTILLLIIMIGGTFGYTLVEDGWSLFDGFYMTLITLTTIGFSEVHTLTFGGRLLTVAIIIFGMGAAATILGQLAQLLMEGDLATIWRTRRMEKRIARMKNHVIICGYGRIGQAICQDLTNMGVECVIIDREDKRVDSAQELRIPVLSGNATADLALLAAGVERAAILVAALSNDSDNLFVALAARDLNSELMVIARGEDKSIETRMLRAGVDRVVYPAQLGGGQIARLVGAELGQDPDTDERRRLTDIMGYQLQVYRNFCKGGTTIGEIQAKTGALRAVAHIDAQDVRHSDPEADHVVAEGESVVLVVEVVTGPEAIGEADSVLPKDLSLGIPAIDEEHRRILQMIRRLNREDEDRSRQVTGSDLKDLRDYTLRHFKHEEELFKSVGYPEAEAHAAEHKGFIAYVDRLAAESGQLQRDNLADLLDEWVRNHIMQMDRHYVKCVSEHKARSSLPEAGTVEVTCLP